MDIQIKNLKKYYGENQVLDIESLAIKKQRITGIIGPNGCGKTTLLNIIAGLDKEYLGNINYNNKKINKEIVSNMTIVFQKPYLFRRSVYDNIEYPLKIRGIDRQKSKPLVEDIMKRLEIEDLRDKKAHRLSGGESQKVALGRALVFNPKLLLLDEPTSNIDPEYIVTMESEIKKFNRENKGTVIIVTHNIEQSKRLCDNIIGMENGRVVY
ncbi:ATP-binding cassette domain-containing protein [Wansuia hejianensis]|uniref:ATP-binding cassette domain-containing protein n=1 Tax=Wansuia hejianensis TaxID=2763667 RepID=A0A926F0A8_9FIRM|nr:ATP-binding cassette domain-containing protein [Wansuia hejianensis]